MADGNRYYEQFSPDFENIVTSVAGQTGSYDFGVDIKERLITLECFCNGITEFERRWVEGWLAPGKVGKLVYDESPFKYYMVKLASPTNFSFIPYSYGISGEGILYKGTFTLELVALYPYALSRFNTLDELIYDNPSGALYYNSGLLYSEIIPPAIFENITNNFNAILYNGGNANAKANVKITGTWNELTIINRSTDQEFTLGKNDVISTFEVDANLGQCRHSNLGVLATDYHDGTYLHVEGTGWVDMYEGISFISGSDIVSFPANTALDEGLEGKFIFMEDGQYEIKEIIGENQIRLMDNFVGTSGDYNITIAKANKIAILGSNLNISRLEFAYKYTYY